MTDASLLNSGFPASILVHTPGGLVPIGQLRAGDLVRSTDVVTGVSGDRQVLETRVLEAAQLDVFRWGWVEEDGGTQEGVAVAGAAQRYWVVEGTDPGWTDLSNLAYGDQAIAALAVPQVFGYGTEAGFFATDAARVGFTPTYRGADDGIEVEFDAAGAITAFRGGVPETDTTDLRRPFRSATHQLVVDGAHTFHVLEAGLLVADLTQYE